MIEQDNYKGWSPSGPNGSLASLLDILDAVIADARSTAQGKTLPVLEAELTEALRQSIPDAKFMGMDIRLWATEIANEPPPR